MGSAVGLALAVAASRVLLDVHWLSDVVAGVLLGWAWFSLCAIVFGSRVLRVRAPGTTTPDGASGRCGAIGEV